MGNVTNLTTSQVQKVQFDEAVIVLNYGLATERVLGPTRGGGEFAATISVRDVEFDGKIGKTAGMQVVEEQAALIKTTSLCLSQEELQLAMPGCRVTGSGASAVIKNPASGVISTASYLSNVTMFGKLADGTYKKATIFNAMTESGITLKAVAKAEGELELEFHAHYTTSDLDGDLWEIKELSDFRAPVMASAETATNGLKVLLTFNHAMAASGLDKAHYTVKQSDVSKTISSIALASGDAQIVELTMSSALATATTITVAYTKGTTADAAGKLLDTFADAAVTNLVAGT